MAESPFNDFTASPLEKLKEPMTQMATKDRCPTCGSDDREIRNKRSCEMMAPPHNWKWITDDHLSATDFIECHDPWHEGRSSSPAVGFPMDNTDAWEERQDAARQSSPAASKDDLDLAAALHISYCAELADEGEPWEAPAEPEPQYFATLKEAIIFLVNLPDLESEGAPLPAPSRDQIIEEIRNDPRTMLFGRSVAEIQRLICEDESRKSPLPAPVEPEVIRQWRDPKVAWLSPWHKEILAYIDGLKGSAPLAQALLEFKKSVDNAVTVAFLSMTDDLGATDPREAIEHIRREFRDAEMKFQTRTRAEVGDSGAQTKE